MTDHPGLSEQRALIEQVARAVMQWGAPHFKHIVSFNTLCEAIEAASAQPPAKEQASACSIPPAGWHCTRNPGHEGPCAALPIAAVERALAKWNALPDDERNGERPYVMGFNEGWDAAFAQPPASGVDREAKALLEACTGEFGWNVDCPDESPVTDDPDCLITWGHLRGLHAALTNSGAPVPGDGFLDELCDLEELAEHASEPLSQRLLALIDRAKTGWIEWTGDASTIPSGMGWVQFSHETREQAMQREPSEVDHWPWYGEDEKPCVLAYRMPASAVATGTRNEEPFGYWVEQKHADPVLLRKPAYIPEPSNLRTVTPLYAHAAPAPSDEERWRHVKRGTVYEVIGRGELQMSFDALVDGSSMVVYRGEDGKIWVREEGEFEDGRFERLEDADAGVPAGMVLGADRSKWLKAAAEFLDYCAGTELEFEGCDHSALAIVEGLHEALFDDEMDMPFHEAVAWCLDNTPKQATPTDEAASQGWQPIETAPKDGTGVLLIDQNSEKPEAGTGWFVFDVWSAVSPIGALALGRDVFHAMVWTAPTHWQLLPKAPESPAPGSGGEAGDA